MDGLSRTLFRPFQRNWIRPRSTSHSTDDSVQDSIGSRWRSSALKVVAGLRCGSGPWMMDPSGVTVTGSFSSTCVTVWSDVSSLSTGDAQHSRISVHGPWTNRCRANHGCRAWPPKGALLRLLFAGMGAIRAAMLDYPRIIGPIRSPLAALHPQLHSTDHDCSIALVLCTADPP